jgi:hypothetical protein
MAAHEVLLLSDVGALPDRQWAEKLLLPFCHDASLTGVFGFYRAIGDDGIRTEVLKLVTPKLAEIDPATFLPSGRSFALRRKGWKAAGGYPEYLTLAGEDTLFDYYLKCRFSRFAFVPEATADWFPQRRLFRMIANYASGDAEGGKLFWSHYSWLVTAAASIGFETALSLFFALLAYFTGWALLLLPLLIFVPTVIFRLREIVHRFSPVFHLTELKPRLRRISSALFVASAQTYGFVRGLGRRRAVEERRLREVQGEVLILANTLPFAAQGADQKVDQTVDEYLRGGWEVTVVLLAREQLAAHRDFDHPHYREFFKDDFSLPRDFGKLLAGQRFVIDLAGEETSLHRALKQRGIQFLAPDSGAPRKAAAGGAE